MKMEAVQTVRSAIVHKLLKARGSKEISIEARDTALDTTAALQKLVDAVHDAYAKKTGKSYGAFENNAELHPAQTYIRKLVDEGEQAFVGASKDLLRLLAQKAKKEQFATGGYVLIADIFNGANRFFLVAMLTDVAGAAITDDLEVVESVHLDLSAMRFAGRVNITDWYAGNDRYISFLRGKKADVSEYFQDFLGCSTLIKPLQETQHLVGAVKKFATDHELDDQRREKLLAEVDAYGRECIKEGKPLELETLANRVWPEEPAVLQDALAKSDPPISDGFIPDGRGLRELKKFKASTKTWTLEFERAAMSDHTIQFDPKTRVLKITQIPDDIAAKLTQEFSNDEDAP